MTNELDTYEGWVGKGRVIQAGQKASVYAYLIDGTTRAVFSQDQTVPLEPVDLTDAEIVPAEEHRKRKEPKPVRRVKLRYRDVGNGDYEIAIWCGSNTDIIKMLQRRDYHYSGRRHRWLAVRPDPQDVIKGLRAAGYEVDES